jgi:hypothetical protein
MTQASELRIDLKEDVSYALVPQWVLRAYEVYQRAMKRSDCLPSPWHVFDCFCKEMKMHYTRFRGHPALFLPPDQKIGVIFVGKHHSEAQAQAREVIDSSGIDGLEDAGNFYSAVDEAKFDKNKGSIWIVRVTESQTVHIYTVINFWPTADELQMVSPAYDEKVLTLQNDLVRVCEQVRGRHPTHFGR